MVGLNKIIKWTPRIISIMFILFLSLFAFDSFSEPGIWYLLLAGFLIHLIPTFFLIGFLVLAWKKPLIGGIAYLVIALSFIFFFNLYRDIISFLLIGLPVIITGSLFMLSYFRKN